MDWQAGGQNKGKPFPIEFEVGVWKRRMGRAGRLIAMEKAAQWMLLRRLKRGSGRIVTTSARTKLREWREQTCKVGSRCSESCREH